MPWCGGQSQISRAINAESKVAFCVPGPEFFWFLMHLRLFDLMHGMHWYDTTTSLVELNAVCSLQLSGLTITGSGYYLRSSTVKN